MRNEHHNHSVLCVLQEWSQYEEVSYKLLSQLYELETDMSSLNVELEGDLQAQLRSYEVSSTSSMGNLSAASFWVFWSFFEFGLI